MRSVTESHLKKIGIVYDILIMGLGGGARVLINDRKPNSTKNTAFAINLIRNEGLKFFDFSSEVIIRSFVGLADSEYPVYHNGESSRCLC